MPETEDIDFTPDDLEPDEGEQYVEATEHEFKGDQNLPEDAEDEVVETVVLPDEEVEA